MAADDDDEEVQEEGQTPAERRHSTDELLPRELILTILDDYVRYVYPLLPVVHCPTFAEELSEGRDADDEELLALIVSLCAATVCLLPSRLAIYRTQGLPFTTRTAMANHCWSLYQDLRKGPAYFDTVSHTKWAASYMLAIAFHQTGNANLWRMLDVESMQLLRLLDVHRPESYINLDPIQVQLRKKAFCLVFNGCVHHAYNLATERLSFLDLAVLRDINLDDLLPLPLDDDYISHTGVLPCPPDIAGASVTAGFILNVSVFAAALESSAPTAAALILCCSGCTGTCARAGNDGLDARIAALRRHHHRNRYMLDSIIPAYRSWGHRPDSFSQTPNQDTTAAIQRDAIRANIHATHLWLQSMLLDQIDAAADTATIATPASTASSPPETQATTPALASWDEREDICRQLLHIIHSTPSLSLEANGSALVSPSLPLPHTPT